MKMLDLCAGRGGASQAMRARGWHVTTVDNDPAFDCDVTTDIREWCYDGPPLDLIWSSPPCTEFSRESMPWCRTGQAPDMSIVLACLRITMEAQPRMWVLENTRGAAPWFRAVLGPPRQIVGPFFLWGNFPPLAVDMRTFRKKESYPSSRPDLRAMVPASLSLAIAVAAEQQLSLC